MTTIKELIAEAEAHHANGTMTLEIYDSLIERAKPLVEHAPLLIGAFTKYAPLEIWERLKPPHPLQHA